MLRKSFAPLLLATLARAFRPRLMSVSRVSTTLTFLPLFSALLSSAARVRFAKSSVQFFSSSPEGERALFGLLPPVLAVPPWPGSMTITVGLPAISMGCGWATVGAAVRRWVASLSRART
ncbi:hypothetical protein D3C85_1537970 [compost metagenome]